MLIKNFRLGWVAESGDYEQLNKVISKIQPFELNSELNHKIKETALKKFDFESQLTKLIKVI
ncbi:MAG: hypothetical protein P8X62_09340 [Flavobacteriaceae bacterium]